MTVYQTAQVAANNPTPGAITIGSGPITSNNPSGGNGGGVNPFNPTGLTPEQYLAMTPEQRNAYDSANAARMVSQGIISPSMGASIQQTISGGLSNQFANQGKIQGFEQTQGMAQNQFTNQISQGKVGEYAKMADQAQMASALGLGTNQVSPEVSAAYAQGQSFRETRAEQVARGAKGTDVSYPSGVKSPVYSENIPQAVSSSAVGVSLVPPKEQLFSPMTQEQYNANLTAMEFKAASAPGVVGGMSLASGGWMSLSENKQAVSKAPQSPVQNEAINMAAAWESAPGISFLKSSAEGIQAQNKPGAWFGNYARDFTGSLIRTPEMIGKTGIAAAGIGKAVVVGDVQAFNIGVPSSRDAVVKTATNPEFYVSSVITAGIIGVSMGGKGGYAAKPIENVKFTLNEGTSYSGIASFSKPIIGITTIEGKGSVVVGTPRFGGGRPGIIEMSENRADVNTLAGYNIKKAAYTDYAKASNQPALGERFALTTEAGSSTYYTNIPFSKAINTMLEAEALKNLPAQSKSNIVGYFEQNKGQVVEFYGSFASDVRGASARGFNDIDLHVKSENFGVGLAEAINKGGGKATLQEGMLLVDNVKAFDIKTNTLDVGATTMEGSGEGIGFGFTPKKAVSSPEKYPFMATGEQTVRVGSSLNFLREGKTGEFLGGSSEKVQRVSDFIALVEKSSEVSGNKKFANFGQQFKPYLNPNEKAYFAENPTVAGKLNLYTAPAKASPSGSFASFAGSSPSFVKSITGSQSMSASPSFSPSFSISASVSPSSSPSKSLSASISKSISSISKSPSRSVSPSLSISPSFSPSISPSLSPSISPSFSPSITPSYSPSIAPRKPGGSGGGGSGLGGFSLDMSGGFEFGKKTKKAKGKYTPSFIARELGIKTTKAQGLQAEVSGIDIRGIIGKMRK